MSPRLGTIGIRGIQRFSDRIGASVPLYVIASDGFDVLDNVDVAGATNLDAGTAGVLKPTTGSETRVTGGTMTSPLGAGTPSNLNDNNTGTTSSVYINDLSAVSDISNRIFAKLDLGSTKTISKIECKQYRYSAGGLAAQGLYYSTDGSNWAILGSKFAATTAAVNVERTGRVSARYVAVILDATLFQVTVTASDLNAYEPPATNNLTVRSAAFTAASVPTAMKGIIRVKEVDAATANTDYTLEFSRDDGANWALATITELFTAPGSIRVCETNLVDVSGQPSGTNLRWRFKTLNNKMIELDDLVLCWK